MKGHEGWDDYAAYYDWENAQTVGRRDIAFWQRMAASGRRSPILELGCGTGRVAIPVAKAGATVDRHRSIRIDAGARAHESAARAAGIARQVDSRRHPPPAVSRQVIRRW